MTFGCLWERLGLRRRAGRPSQDLINSLRHRHQPLNLDALFTEPEISRAANNIGLFDQVEADAYERGYADAEADRKIA